MDSMPHNIVWKNKSPTLKTDTKEILNQMIKLINTINNPIHKKSIKLFSENQFVKLIHTELKFIILMLLLINKKILIDLLPLLNKINPQDLMILLKIAQLFNLINQTLTKLKPKILKNSIHP